MLLVLLGMLDWGGENIEQSLRVWMCGGKILVDREAKIGHIFERPAPKNKVRSGQVSTWSTTEF